VRVRFAEAVADNFHVKDTANGWQPQLRLFSVEFAFRLRELLSCQLHDNSEHGLAKRGGWSYDAIALEP